MKIAIAKIESTRPKIKFTLVDDEIRVKYSNHFEKDLDQWIKWIEKVYLQVEDHSRTLRGEITEYCTNSAVFSNSNKSIKLLFDLPDCFFNALRERFEYFCTNLSLDYDFKKQENGSYADRHTYMAYVIFSQRG